MVQSKDNQESSGPDAREAVQLFLQAVRRHLPRVVFTTLVFLMVGLFLAKLWPEKYESETQFMLREQRIISDVAQIEEIEEISLPRKLESMKNELRSMNRVASVLDDLQWEEWLETAGYPSRRKAFYLKVKSNMTIGMSPDVTGAINVTIGFQWTSPEKAKDFVNHMRESWTSLVLESHRGSLEAAKERAERVVIDRQQEYNDALKAVTTYQEENDVAGLYTVEINNEMIGDYQVKLSEAQAKLQSAVTVAQSLEAELRVLEPEYETEVLAADPVQQQAYVQYKKAQAEMDVVAEKYMPAHRNYEDAERKLALAEKALEEAGGVPTQSTSLANNPDFLKKAALLTQKMEEQREFKALVENYQTEIDAANERLARLPIVEADLLRLNEEVATASALLTDAKLKVQPLRDQVASVRNANAVINTGGGLFSGRAFEIIDVGIEAENPVLPIGAILLALSLILGVGVGLSGPVLSEMTRSSFGSVKEVSRTLGVPVLGAVDMILTPRDVRARHVQSALTYTTMALVLAALATALYIYSFHPQVLPAGVMRTLRDLRLTLT